MECRNAAVARVGAALVPLPDLHQEQRCTMSGAPGAFGWRIGAAACSVLGAYLTSMLVLTVSGVLRRNVER